MNLINDCPECGKQISNNRMQCNCGWTMTVKEESPVTDVQCQYREKGWRCDEVGTFGPRWAVGKWYCYDHWEEIRNRQNKY